MCSQLHDPTPFLFLLLIALAHLTACQATMSRFLRFVVTGAPGSGKGTISAWMVRDFRLRHVAAGDLLRQQIKQQTGACVLAVMDDVVQRMLIHLSY